MGFETALHKLGKTIEKAIKVTSEDEPPLRMVRGAPSAGLQLPHSLVIFKNLKRMEGMHVRYPLGYDGASHLMDEYRHVLGGI